MGASPYPIKNATSYAEEDDFNGSRGKNLWNR